jgi:hypothetical protein
MGSNIEIAMEHPLESVRRITYDFKKAECYVYRHHSITYLGFWQIEVKITGQSYRSSSEIPRGFDRLVLRSIAVWWHHMKRVASWLEIIVTEFLRSQVVRELHAKASLPRAIDFIALT